MSKLGTYEMVTSLSENTVNGLFAGRFALHEIHHVWSSRITFDGKHHRTGVIIDEGYTTDASYDAVNEKFTAAFNEADGKTFMSGFIATIKSPYISIQHEDIRQVSFNIPFAKGRLDQTYKDEPGIDTLDLAGVVYVFTVELDRIHYSNFASVTDPIANAALQQYIADTTSGTPELRPEDFTIEKLFLNFETARFAADSARTKYPQSWTDADREVWDTFQGSLQAYFTSRTFKERQDAYVLGYGVTIPVPPERAPAVFQPKSLDFSTSFVPGPVQGEGNGRKCSLNYLMMITHAPVNTAAAGSMNSLLGNYDVLAIDYPLFYDKYLKKVIELIAAQLTETLATLGAKHKERDPNPFISVRGEETIETSGAFSMTHGQELRVDFGSAMVKVKSYRQEQIMSGGGMTPSIETKTYDYRKTINPEPWADITFPEDSKLQCSILRIDLKFLLFAEYFYGSSKKATTTQDNAGLYIDLHPGTDGTMSVDIHPYGESSEARLTSGSSAAVYTVDDAISGDFYSKLRLPTFLDDLKRRLKEGIKTLPKVILPISNVYNYKSVGYIKAGEDETNGVITFEASYTTKAT